jgi:2-polyprenyl-3-methyl-5-hydroxy-6-metoxy-1,4-benzoquinol methylase
MNYNDYWKTWTDPYEPFNNWEQMSKVYPRLAWIDKTLTKLKKKTVLDVGCGQGHITIPLSLRGHSITGLDVSSFIISTAQKKAQDYSATPTFLCEDIFTHTGLYDALIATHIMEHMDDPSLLCKKLLSLVCKGGVLFFTFPLYLGDELDHKHAFTIEGIREMFEKHNQPYAHILFNEVHKGIVWVCILI